MQILNEENRFKTIMKYFSLFTLCLLLLVIHHKSIAATFLDFPDKIDTKQERINLQTTLNRVMIPSPNLVVDGVIGKKTIQTIQAFQDSQGLDADGKVGPVTRKALEDAQVNQGITRTSTSSVSNTSTAPTSVNTNTSTSGVQSFVCAVGSLFNIFTGQPCDSVSTVSTSNATLPIGCTPTTKFSTVTGAYCGDSSTSSVATTTTLPIGCTSTTRFSTVTGVSCDVAQTTIPTTTIIDTTTLGNNSSTTSTTSSGQGSISKSSGGGGGGGGSSTPTCSGPTVQSCTVTNGTGTQSRTCNNGTWSSYSTCVLSACDTGYEQSGSTCVAVSGGTPTTPTCTGSSVQSCTITNGTGTQTRTCNSGTWSGYGSCTVASCNSGYQISGNTCVVIPAPVCTGSATQSCTITNGTGTQTRTCNSGTWSGYGSCTVSSCNSGYQISGNTCVSAPSSSWQSGLVSWWKFEGNANDSVGSNNGTVNGATSTGSGCKSGSCYNFNGVNSYIEFPSSSSLDLSGNQFSMSTWFVPTVDSETTMLIAKPASSSSHIAPYFSYNLQQYGGGTNDYPRSWIATMNNPNGAYTTYTGDVLNVGQLYNATSVYDGSQLCTYLDGSLLGSCVPATGNLNTFNTPLRLGINGGLGEPFGGYMDETMLWNRALNSSEVQDVYTAFSGSSSCTGSATQSCTITNGTGTQTRTCNSGTWSGYGSCTVSSCNSGYQISGNTCVLVDTTNPVVTSFSLPSTYSSLTVPVSSFSATDNIAVTGYLLTESSVTPSAGSGSWSSSPQTSYTFSLSGSKTLYAWVRDAAGNVSASASSSVIITVSAVSTSGLYVSLSGNDTNDGTTTSTPLRTLDAARNKIRTMKTNNQIPSGGITVWIRGGVYELSSSFVLDSQDTGTASKPITYASYPGETVRIVGAKKLNTSDFSLVASSDSVYSRLRPEAKGNVYKLNLSAYTTNYGTMNLPLDFKGSPVGPMELFANDEHLQLARWPNVVASPTGSTNDSTGYALATRTASNWQFSYVDSRIDNWATAENPWVTGFLGTEFGECSAPISVNASSNIFSTTGTCISYTSSGNRPFFGLNLLEEIDVPGEYYLNRNNGMLYYYPTSSIGSQELYVSMLDTPLVSLNSTSYINFDGISFEMVRGKLIDITNGNHIVINHSKIKHAGQYGISMNGNYLSVINSEISNTGSDGIRESGGDRVTLTSSGNRIVNNEIYNVGYWTYTYSPAINLLRLYQNGANEYSVGAYVAHNYIHDVKGNAIFPYGLNAIVEYNEITRVVTDSADMGAIYVGEYWTSRNNTIRYNYIHDIVNNPRFNANVIGIYFDFTIPDQSAYGNIISNVRGEGILHSSGPYTTIEDNIILNTNGAYFALNLAYVESWIAQDLYDSYPVYTNSYWRAAFPELADNIARPYKNADGSWNYSTITPYAHPYSTSVKRNIAWNSSPFKYTWQDASANTFGLQTFQDNLENTVSVTLNPSTRTITYGSPSAVAATGFREPPFSQMGLSSSDLN